MSRQQHHADTPCLVQPLVQDRTVRDPLLSVLFLSQLHGLDLQKHPKRSEPPQRSILELEDVPSLYEHVLNFRKLRLDELVSSSTPKDRHKREASITFKARICKNIQYDEDPREGAIWNKEMCRPRRQLTRFQGFLASVQIHSRKQASTIYSAIVRKKSRAKKSLNVSGFLIKLGIPPVQWPRPGTVTWIVRVFVLENWKCNGDDTRTCFRQFVIDTTMDRKTAWLKVAITKPPRRPCIFRHPISVSGSKGRQFSGVDSSERRI